MCLLVALFQVIPGAPLIFAANRDELLARPALTMTVLQESGPRLVGGKDLLAGGTWLAVGDQGLIAGLTNKPATRDPTLRSRGELPLLVAGQASADEAAKHIQAHLRAEERSPAWLLFGDRNTLYYADLTGKGAPTAEPLQPGIHVLENSPLHVATRKSERVRAEVGKVVTLSGDALKDALFAVLKSHERSEGSPPTEAACVHAGVYGTRSSLLAVVGEAGAPTVWWTDGPPCVSEVLGGPRNA